MFDRHWLGDVGLAVLLALPLTALAQPQPISRHRVASLQAMSVASADRAPEGRISLLGSYSSQPEFRSPLKAQVQPFNRSSQPAPSASEIESSTVVLWSRRIAKARRMAQVASSWQSPHGA